MTGIANIFLFFGSFEEKRGFFIPWLIVKALGIMALCVFAFVLIGDSNELAQALQLDETVIIWSGGGCILAMRKYIH